MEISAAGKMIGTAVSIAKAGWNAMKPDLARRKVAAGERFDFNTIDTILDKTLNIMSGTLEDGTKDASTTIHRWLSNPPPEFSYAHIQEWIRDQRTRSALKKAVLDAFNGIDDPQNIEQASVVFEEVALDKRSNAEPYIDMALQFLAQTISTYISPSEKLILDAVNSRAEESKQLLKGVKEGQDKISNAIARIGTDLEVQIATLYEGLGALHPQDAIDQFVRRHLDRILKRRWFSEANTCEELREVAVRVDGGNLGKANNGLRIEVFLRTARLFLDKDLDESKRWIRKAKELDSTLDFRPDDARVLIQEGKIPEALVILRDCNTSDAQSLVLDAINKRDGFQAAFDYFKSTIGDIERLSASATVILGEEARKSNQHDVADEILSGATSAHIEECPVILALRAKARLALCLPEIERSHFDGLMHLHPSAVKFSDEPTKLELRRQALADIDQFLQETQDLGIPLYRQHIEEIQLWLRLSHPDENIRSAASQYLTHCVKDLTKATQFARLAIDYGANLDVDQLVSYLNTRKVLGGWNQHEAVAALSANLHAKDPEKTLRFIREHHSELEKSIDAHLLAALEIEAQAITGDTEGAEKLINMRELVLGTGSLELVRNRIREIKGEDALAIRKVAFEQSQSDLDRKLYVDELIKRRNFELACVHLVVLFSHLPTINDAILISGYYVEAGDYTGLRTFLERSDVSRLIPSSDELQNFCAWSAYFLGDLNQASSLVAPLRKRRNHENDRRLAINLAIESGHWEELNQFLAEDLANADIKTTGELIAAAQTGRVINFPNNEAIVDAVAEKGMKEKDSNALVAAYHSVVNLGLDEKKKEANNWLKEAISLSGPEGPIRSFPLRDMVDLVDKERERETFINGLISSGQAPLVIAAGPLKVTLSDIIGGNLIRNSRIDDVRRKVALPLFAGTRNFGSINDCKCIALDRSALLVLEFVGMLETVLENFERIVIPRGTLGEFLSELGQVLYHQPSRVQAAEHFLTQIAAQKVYVLDASKKINEVIPSEVDEELRQLISAANQDGGTVIVSPPVYKVGSFMDEVVDLSSLMHLIAGPQELIDFLEFEGEIGDDDALMVRSALYDGEARWDRSGRIHRNQPIYLDDIAADRFARSGLTEILFRVFPRVYVTEFSRQQATALVEYARRQQEVEELVQRIRKQVSLGIKNGKIKIAPAHGVRSEPHQREIDMSLQSLMKDPGDADVVIFDDRAINRLGHMTVASGRDIPIATSIDLLFTLKNRGVISDNVFINVLRKLRKSGAVFLPIMRSELHEAATKGKPESELSFELRSISNYMDFVRIRKLLKLPDEAHWFSQVTLEFKSAIISVWESSHNKESATTGAKRLLNILPDAYYWISPDAPDEVLEWARRTYAIRISYLGNGLLLRNSSLLDSYLQWVEDDVIAPLQKIEPSIVADAAEFARAMLLRSMNEVPDEIEKSLKRTNS